MKQQSHEATLAATQTQMKGAPFLAIAKVVGLALLTCLAVQAGLAEPAALTACRGQRDQAIEQIHQEAKAREKRINEQYVLSLDALMNSLTRAGKLDEALAVRDEKIRVNASLGIKATTEDGPAKRTAERAKSSPHPNQNKVVEGEGWRGFRVGATREELIKELGTPDADSTSQWLKWKKSAVHCLIDDKFGASELRFDDGFKGETSAGIEIGSALKKALAAYGEPTTQEEKGTSKKLEWSSKGVLVWFNEGKVSQLVVFRKK